MSDTGDISDVIGQPSFVPKCSNVWLDRKLLAADSVFSLQGRGDRGSFARGLRDLRI